MSFSSQKASNYIVGHPKINIMSIGILLFSVFNIKNNTEAENHDIKRSVSINFLLKFSNKIGKLKTNNTIP